MINFLLKGVLRDRHRSLFPVLVVVFGVMITCFFYSYLNGVFGDMFLNYARYDTGHVKITTRGYAQIPNQLPNDLGLDNAVELMEILNREYPELEWESRIRFGGLFDFPDESGNTTAQGAVIGMGLDLLEEGSREVQRLDLASSVVAGRLPQAPGEILIGEKLLEDLKVQLGDTGTLISSTANGAMAIANFKPVGAIRLGAGMLDRKMIIVDVSDARALLDMQGWAGEILGFSPNMVYFDQKAEALKIRFNATYSDENDEYSPLMKTLGDQNGLGEYLEIGRKFSFILIFVFVFVMSIVLWNTGLISGMRRYGEMGVRLAIGESKGHIYRTLLVESFLIGLIGSVVGTAIGLSFSYYLQEVGINIGNMIKGSEILYPEVMRAKVTATSYYIGFIPGLLATILGSLFSGIGIYKRQTALLMKDLES